MKKFLSLVLALLHGNTRRWEDRQNELKVHFAQYFVPTTPRKKNEFYFEVV
jgi:hypothetical protein